jgi:AhpD family alkylhydroperoxidase
MARLPYPDPASLPPRARALSSQMAPHSAVNMMMHSPAVAEQYLGMAGANFSRLELGARERELIVLVVASLIGCEYEYAAHSSVSEAAGVAPRVREALWRGEFDDPALRPDDRRLVEFVRGIVVDGAVSDQVFAEIASRHSSREVVEIVELIGFYWMYGQFCKVLGLDPPEEGAEHAIAVVSAALAGQEGRAGDATGSQEERK